MRTGSSAPAKISTPVIIIRLVGRSMRSHAVSTFDIGSRRARSAIVLLPRRRSQCRRSSLASGGGSKNATHARRRSRETRPFYAIVGVRSVLPRSVSPMHQAAAILLDLFVIFVAAQIGAEIAQRIKLPGVVGEIVAGCVIGPSALGWIATADIAPGTPLDVLAEIGV